MSGESLETIILPRVHDLGGFKVRRALPYRSHRNVGPFVFFDHLGPAALPAGHGIDVRPHPHIGLATVTWLFEGALDHRDSLGSVQTIRPGAVNWMTAGRGIVHSERTPDAERAAGHSIEAIQTWVALPRSHEEQEPAFVHHPAETIPDVDLGDCRVRLISGNAFGARSPVEFPVQACEAAVEMTADGGFETPDIAECAVYVVSGSASIDGQPLEEASLAVLKPGTRASVTATKGARLMLVGGDALDAKRLIDWNLVASDAEKIERARADWRKATATGFVHSRFSLPPGETRWTPYPGDPEPNPEDIPPGNAG